MVIDLKEKVARSSLASPSAVGCELCCSGKHNGSYVISSFAVCPHVYFSQSPSPKMALTPEETGTGLSGARTPVASGTGRRETTPSLATVQVCTGSTLINAHQVH